MSNEALMFKYDVDTPWLKYYHTVPQHLSYPDCSMVDMIKGVAEKYPDYTAFVF